MHKLQYIKYLIMYNLCIEISGRTAVNNVFRILQISMQNIMKQYNMSVLYYIILFLYYIHQK